MTVGVISYYPGHVKIVGLEDSGIVSCRFFGKFKFERGSVGVFCGRADYGFYCVHKVVREF